MKWAVLVAALVALLIVESFSAPTPKDKKAKNAKGINEKETNKKDVASEDNNKKVDDAKDADEKDEDVKNADEKDEDVKNADEKDEDVNNADEKDEDVKNADEKDEDVKNADEKDEDGEDANEKDDDVKNADEKDEDGEDTDSKKAINKVKTEVTLDITETQTTMTKDEKTETTKEAIVDEVQEKTNDNTANEFKEGISEEEVNMDDEYVIDELEAEAVKGHEKNLIEDMAEDLYLPISGRLKSAMLPESDRVMDEPDFLPRTEAVMGEAAEGSVKQRVEERQSLGPTAERVMMAQEAGTKPGGDGKMKMNLNLKDLDGNPSDLTVGAAAVGLMSQAVKSKGPDDNQVNAVAGFGHQIMGLVSELEKDSK